MCAREELMPELALTQAPTLEPMSTPASQAGGAVDGGQQRLSLRVGCGCSPDASAPGVWWMVTIGLLALARRRRSLRMALASVHVLKALGGPDAHSK
jgi:hypothetical protein